VHLLVLPFEFLPVDGSEEPPPGKQVAGNIFNAFAGRATPPEAQIEASPAARQAWILAKGRLAGNESSAACTRVDIGRQVPGNIGLAPRRAARLAGPT